MLTTLLTILSLPVLVLVVHQYLLRAIFNDPSRARASHSSSHLLPQNHEQPTPHRPCAHQ